MAEAAAIFLIVAFAITLRYTGLRSAASRVALTFTTAQAALKNRRATDREKELASRVAAFKLFAEAIRILGAMSIAIGLIALFIYLFDATGVARARDIIDIMSAWPSILGGAVVATLALTIK